jgi:putative membrane-bound dehydrogenase-like protein
VSGSLDFPGRADLDRTDVLVLYAAEGGSIHSDERARLGEYLGAGGGIVVLHDAVCGDDPQWFKRVVGGAWEHGRSKWHTGEIGLVFADREHPITRGTANFDFEDEIYWDLHLDPGARVLANSFHTPFDVTPQMWVYEQDDYRAFVSIQGHFEKSFAHPAWRTLLLRGIAWAGKRDADLLVSAEEVRALRYPPGGPLAPEQAGAALEVHPDFRVELVAAEPMVVNPISLDWDASGRMWVALTPGYPDKQEFSGLAARDSIVILDDTDGDGRMDSRQVFHEGLDLVTSLVLFRDGVIVSQSPEILYLADTDGDDRADERTVLYSGFGYADTHAVLSNLRWGLDGWIYATQGYSGNASKHIIGRSGEDFGSVPNGLLRFKPDGSAIETVSSYGSNTWGCDFTWDGELFFSMANGSHLRHVQLPESILARGRVGDASSWKDIVDHRKAFPLSMHERAPYQQIDFVGGFTAAAGSLIYSGGQWPEEFRGNHFVCEPTINLIHRDQLWPDGISFKATKPREAEFLASKDRWFRPVHLRTGPDGQMYVLDFYNQAAIHNDTRGPEHGPTNAAVRPDRDHLHGRIWRVRHRSADRLVRPSLPQATPAQLAGTLDHADMWWRMTAQRLLLEAPRSSQPDLQPVTDAGRVHSMWIAHQRGDYHHPVLQRALRETTTNSGVIKNAAWIAALEGIDGLQQELLELLRSPDVRTRLAAIVALASWTESVDPWNLATCYARLEDDVSRSAVLGLRDPRFLASALGVEATEISVGDLIEQLAERVGRTRDPIEIAAAIANLSLSSSSIHPEVIEDALRRMLREMGEELLLEPSAALTASLGDLLDCEHLGVASAALSLAGRCESDGLSARVTALADRLLATLVDLERPSWERLMCLSTLLALPDRRQPAIEAARSLLDPQESMETQRQAIDHLGGTSDRRAAAVLVDAWPVLSARARERAFRHLIGRPEWTRSLLDAIEAGDVRATDLGPIRLHRLRHHAHEATAQRAVSVLERFAKSGDGDMDALIAKLLPEVEGPAGDLERGRELFAQNCASCHAVDGDGGRVGPDLTGMGTHGVAELLPYIVDPNRSVEAAYLEYVARTTDGQLYSGVLARESADSILLRGSDGDFEVRREDLEDLRSSGRSPMPTGFETLGAAGLRDILAYLAGGYEGFRTLDLRAVCNASTRRSMYDPAREDRPMRFVRHGVVDVEGVPFELLDGERFDKNVIVLKGGMRDDWDSKRIMPRKLEIPVGFALERVHVLGGIAAWGHPVKAEPTPILRWTWHFADGTGEERVLQDGVEFADWIRRHDVPASQFVPGILREGSWGQVRFFTVEPERGGVVERITIESYDTHAAPTTLALTAELAGARRRRETGVPAGARVLIFGGGSSHDFERWFRDEDLRTLAAPDGEMAYTDRPAALLEQLGQLELLILCNNQALPGEELRRGIEEFVARGGGLLSLHAGTWYNWSDWPEYNAALLGGGARSHEAYGELEVQVLDGEHELTRDVPSRFSIADELYRLELDDPASDEILARGSSPTTGKSWPVLWTRSVGAGRIVGLTLGHDGAAHEHPAFRTLLRNCVNWLRADRR